MLLEQNDAQLNDAVSVRSIGITKMSQYTCRQVSNGRRGVEYEETELNYSNIEFLYTDINNRYALKIDHSPTA